MAEANGEIRSLGTIPNRRESIHKLVRKLGGLEHLRACYEAGPTGYVLYWQLSELGVKCEVVAPTLVPVKAGDRVKTDRRDAEKLARSHRSVIDRSVGPDEGPEALRDLVRAREAAKQDQLRARHRPSKFLLRSGQRPGFGVKAWTQNYLAWVRRLRYAQPAQMSTLLDYLHEVEHMAERVKRLEQAISEAVKLASPAMQSVVRDLQALRGIAEISAVTIASELGRISRFASAPQLMGYSGTVPGEDSSGKRKRRGPITKTGNAHAKDCGGGGLELPAATSHWAEITSTPARSSRADQGDCLESASPALQTIRQAGRGRKVQTHHCHRRGTGAVGFYLGHRYSIRSRTTSDSGLKKKQKLS